MNRETWLNQIAIKMAPRFEELGFPLPPYRVAVGFTSSGKSKKVGGECWNAKNSADKHFEILISPILDDSMLVAGVLAHELAHAADHLKSGHKGDFATIVTALGLKKPLTATTPGPEFIEWAMPFLNELGPIPHARLTWGEARASESGDDDDDEGKGSSNERKKQSTRMLKAACSADGCGYVVRLSRKWALALGAACPEHGASMTIDGLDEEEGDGGDD